MTQARLLNYTTQVVAGKSVGEIQGLLIKHGATKIMLDTASGEIRGIAFALQVGGDELAFRVPANIAACEATLNAQVRSRTIPGRFAGREHASRVAWRILKDWVEAQVALIETGMVKPEEVFLPYLLTDGVHTLFERYQEQRFRELSAPREEA